ncbi:protein unc-93 homolog A-like [Ylistrum balloti]|uniref:protein unc-93 homolog A-like n=1 Tax=Ylistrum balloti TaxID=509963 RepID=UPI0029057F01|nr:protein unc-93 homolog A-like [Ylistrum balloti]
MSTKQETARLVGDEDIGRPLRRETVVRLRLNLVVLCVIFILVFTAYSGLQNLESSLNPGIGIYSLASITGGALISCILAPTVIRFIGAKWAISSAALCLAAFVAANFYPKTDVLIPASILYGMSSGFMLTAQGTYVTTIAIEYAHVIGERAETVISRFFGFFLMAFQSTQIWGNLISSLVLQTDGSSDNATAPKSNMTSDVCGAAFCPNSISSSRNSSATPLLSKPPEHILDTLLIIYIGCALSGFFIGALLLKPIQSRTSEDKRTGIVTTLFSTLRLLGTDTNMLLIVPMAMYSGVEQVVMYAQYTQAYVACELGLSWVGYTMICFGAANTVASPLNGMLTKYVGRPFLFLLGFCVNSGMLVLLRIWTPDKDQLFLFFIIPGVWALADAIWQTQTSALVGHVFPSQQEPAFGNIRMFEALGFFVVYLYSNHVCQDIKLYVVGAWLVLAVTMVFVVEIRIRNRGLAIYKEIQTEENS